MARTHTHPMDFMTKDNHYARHCNTVNEIMEQGRQEFKEQVLSPLMGKLIEIDPTGWEEWYDTTIPEIVSLKEIKELVSARIEEIELEKDWQDMLISIQSVRASFNPF